MDKRVLGAIVVIIILAIAGGAYFMMAPPTGGVPNPDTLIIQTIGEPEYLDPSHDYESAGGEVIENIYETLLWYPLPVDENGEVTHIYVPPNETIPWLAKSYETKNESNHIWVYFYLREGVKFHSGNVMNATAVAWSLLRVVLQYAADPGGSGWILIQTIYGASDFASVVENESATEEDLIQAAEDFLALGSVQVVNETTVKVDLGPTPYAAWEATFAFFVASIVDPWATWENEPDVLKPDLTLNPDKLGKLNEFLDNGGGGLCGTGPFKFKEWVKGQHYAVERFDDYWGSPYNLGPARLQTIVWQSVDDFETRKQSFLAGDADMIYWPTTQAQSLINLTTKEVLPEYADKVRVVTGIPTLTIGHLGFNLNITVEGQPNPFYYKDIRLAFAYAFPYDDFIATALNGIGHRLKSIIPEGLFGFYESDKLPQYNLTKAAEILAKYTWTAENSTIKLYYNSGNEVRETATLMLQREIAKAVKLAKEEFGMPEDVDIVIEVVAMSWPQYLDKFFTRSLQSYLMGWLPDYADPDNYAYPYAHSRGTFAYFQYYNNSQVDAWIEEAQTTLNQTRRAELYKLIQEQVLEDCPYILLYQADVFHVERTWVHGWFYNPILAGYHYLQYKA